MKKSHPIGSKGFTVDTGDGVIAHHLHVVHVVVLADMGHVTHAMTAGEGLVESAGQVQVGAVDGKPPGCVAGHLPQERGASCIIGVAHASAHAVALVQQPPHYPATDKSGGTP